LLTPVDFAQQAKKTKLAAMTTRPTPHSLSAGRLVFIRALRALAQELLLQAMELERGL